MNTLILPATGPDTVVRAAEIIRAGGLLGIPTETVYGLGANAGQPPDPPCGGTGAGGKLLP